MLKKIIKLYPIVSKFNTNEVDNNKCKTCDCDTGIKEENDELKQENDNVQEFLDGIKDENA